MSPTALKAAPKKMQLSIFFQQIATMLRKGFLDRLLAGDVDEARRTQISLNSMVTELKGKVPEQIELALTTNEQLLGEFGATWESFLSLFYTWFGTVQHELGTLTTLEAKKELETYKPLFKTALEQPTDLLIKLAQELTNRASALEAPPAPGTLAPYKYTKKYFDLKTKNKTYIENEALIDRVEEKVRLYLRQGIYNEQYTKPSKPQWKGYRRAWIPAPIDNHRIIYSWDGKTVTFVMIGTHEELGLL